MMAKTIEEMFHPRSVRMRHDILKMQGYGEGDDANTTRGATAGEGSQQQQGLTTVSGKSREDIQRIFVDVIREVGLSLSPLHSLHWHSPLSLKDYSI